MYKRTILRRLCNKEKIHRTNLKDKDLVKYLEFLVKKGVLKFNNEFRFYVADYEKNIDALDCPYIKLKYFYHWQFPPIHKDLPEIKITRLLKTIFEHNDLNFEVFPEEKEEYRLLKERGFILEDKESGADYFLELKKIKKRILADTSQK